jgi:hypothetical protein
MSSLTQREMTFKEIEGNFFEIGCEVARTLMQQYLKKVDRKLAESRNKEELRHRGLKSANIKTLMGEVIFKRALYKRVNEDGGIEYRFFLDEALGFETVGNISPNLVEKIPMHRGGEIPFSNCKVTEARKAIRRMFDLKPFSEMAYR